MLLPKTATRFPAPSSRSSASWVEQNNPGESRPCGKTQFLKMVALRNGGPAPHQAAYQAPAAREHGRPPQALVNPFPLPLLNPGPALVPLAETVAEAAASTLLAPVALVLGLLLGSTTPANAPGISQPHLPPVNPDELRLAELATRHATGTLAPSEEAELMGLLAKVKGIHTENLSDIDPAKKPKYAPSIGKWLGKKGKIDTLKNGDWKYIDWDGKSVVYSKGFPIFDPHARQQVDIPDMKGNCTSDFDAANKDAPLGPKLLGNTWHHHQNLKTMQEVPRGTHERFTHYGARSIIRKQDSLSTPKKSVIRKLKS